MSRSATEFPPSEIDLDGFETIIDLREGNADATQIPGSVRVARSDLDRMERMIPRHDAPVLIYCSIGEISRVTAADLAERGYTGIVSLLGGFRRWRSDGRRATPAGETTVDRYDRHIRLTGIGAKGQRRIREARVLVVGAGGLGSPVIQYLAGAGIGTMKIVDDDRVDTTNLHRQVLFGEEDIGRAKTDAARDAVHRLNPRVTVHGISTRLDAGNAADLIAGFDLVVDASDNFETRLAVNDASASVGVPFIHGAALRWEGMLAAFEPHIGPCYRCLFPVLPRGEEACSDVGVLGAVTGVIGSLMAVEAIKHIVGTPDRLIDRLVTYDARSATFASLHIVRSAECPIGHDAGVPPSR
jgi:molybdopterin/thiamine biosynthesis adenylyltransferase/rhodanese-related sulfurtransferase